MEKKNCTEDTARSASEGIWRKTQQNCMMRRCTYITNPSPLKQLGNKLKNVTPWASRDKNTNRNSCGDYPTCVPCHDTRSCQLPACSKPLINVRCERGEWLDDLRRLGIINFVGDILTLLTFISIGLAIAEYFLCPPLNSSASSDKSYFFCTSCSDAPAAPPQRPPPPPEEEPPPPPPPPEEEPPPPEEEPPPPEEEPPPPPPEEEEENEPLIEEEEPPPEEDEPPLEDEEEEEPPPVYEEPQPVDEEPQPVLEEPQPVYEEPQPVYDEERQELGCVAEFDDEAEPEPKPKPIPIPMPKPKPRPDDCLEAGTGDVSWFTYLLFGQPGKH